MGKKAKLYVIVLINLLAWGYVGYKVYGALQGEDDPAFSGGSMPIKKIDEVAKEEQLTLSLNYPDPFLKGGNFSNKRSGENKVPAAFPGAPRQKPAQTAIAKPTPSLVAAPAISIRYLGLLKNNDKGTQTAMLTVNDRSVFAKQNDVVEGYTIVEIGRDAIKIKKGKELLTISK